MEKITPENIEQYAVRLEDSVQTFGAGEDNVWYAYTAQDGDELMSYIIRERDFPDGRTGMSDRIAYYSDEGGVESLKILTLTLNEDGTVTAAVYVPK